MSQDDKWTGSWVAKKIESHEAVASVEVIHSNGIRVVRKNSPIVIVGTISQERVTKDSIRPLLEALPNACFIATVSKSSVLEGSALRYAKGHGVALGGFGDLLRALNMSDMAAYINPKTQWIELALAQHTRVSSFERLDDYRYLIHRRDRDDVTVLFLDVYELSAAAVRSAFASYESFDVIVKTNPNGSVSEHAHAAAKAAGKRIVSEWRTFLGDLNRKWT